MDRFHFSTAQCFNTCPYQFYLRYLKGFKVLPTDDPSNALILGTALHIGAELGLEDAIRWYKDQYNVITTEHENEIIKLEYWIPRLREQIQDNALHEVNFKNDIYEGTADLLIPDGDKFNLYDFKYSNNIDTYMESEQLHVYKSMLERIKGIKINRMCFVFIPKVQIRQKKTESIEQFRIRLNKELQSNNITVREVEYNPQKVIDFYNTCLRIGMTDQFDKHESFLCDWCDYQDYCQKGITYMLLPKAERRPVGQITKRKLWIYGGAFSGKTSFMDKAPMPINLNTDGNVQFVSMQAVPIKDTMQGRQHILAWKNFKDAIDELESIAGETGFKTIIVDLLEDTYESCRLYMYDKLGITHESDDSFRAWDKVRTEFLSTIRKLMNLDYENIVLISHEDMSKDITKKTGDKITAIKPNIADKVANKIAGMVDIVARVVVEEDDTRTLNFKSNEVIFGGGRLKNISKTSIPLDWDELCKVYDEANGAVPTIEVEAEPVESETDEDDSEPIVEPKRTARKKADDIMTEVGEEATAPRKRRERKVRDNG